MSLPPAVQSWAARLARGARELSFRAAVMRADLGYRRRAGTRMLLVSDGLAVTSEQQFAPIARHAERLRRELGLIVLHLPLGAAMRKPAAYLARFDIVGLKLSFRADESEVLAAARHMRSRLRPDGKLVYFDGDDDSCVQFPAVLEMVDLYVKKHMFRNPGDYAKSRIGKSNLTDYVARRHGWSFADDPIAASGPIEGKGTDKLFLGWNIALDDKIAELAAAIAGRTGGDRPIDVCSRATVPPENWLYPLRAPIADELAKLAGDMTVALPTARVSQDDYYHEMRSSKICVSPFGYGELCWRDFEAILCGCLLIKPNMDHIRTLPDLFVPGVTYVTTAWDFSDLDKQCRRFIADEAARARIVAKARETLLASLEPAWFVARMQDLLHACGR